MAILVTKKRLSVRTLKDRGLLCAHGSIAAVSLKLASEITSDITERPFKRGIAANSGFESY